MCSVESCPAAALSQVARRRRWAAGERERERERGELSGTKSTPTVPTSCTCCGHVADGAAPAGGRYAASGRVRSGTTCIHVQQPTNCQLQELTACNNPSTEKRLSPTAVLHMLAPVAFRGILPQGRPGAPRCAAASKWEQSPGVATRGMILNRSEVCRSVPNQPTRPQICRLRAQSKNTRLRPPRREIESCLHVTLCEKLL